MNSSANHMVIFSHGFGVYADDRGLFPDIIKHLQGVEPCMFDYNQREANNKLVASTLEAQTAKLRQVYNETRVKNPDAIIDLVCHSQGCVIAAMAQLKNVRKTIFLAPADDTFGQNVDEKIQDITKRKCDQAPKFLKTAQSVILGVMEVQRSFLKNIGIVEEMLSLFAFTARLLNEQN